MPLSIYDLIFQARKQIQEYREKQWKVLRDRSVSFGGFQKNSTHDIQLESIQKLLDEAADTVRYREIDATASNSPSQVSPDPARAFHNNPSGERSEPALTDLNKPREAVSNEDLKKLLTGVGKELERRGLAFWYRITII